MRNQLNHNENLEFRTGRVDKRGLVNHWKFKAEITLD
jgi:hypothetical protein